MTEMCFVHCVDNFFTRQISTMESNCLDKCVLKFSNVNQRVMAAYIRDQALINERRMKDMEEQARVNEAAAAASAVSAAEAAAPIIPAANIATLHEPTTLTNSSEIESIANSKASTLEFATGKNSSQNHNQNLVT